MEHVTNKAANGTTRSHSTQSPVVIYEMPYRSRLGRRKKIRPAAFQDLVQQVAMSSFYSSKTLGLIRRIRAG